MDKKEFYNLIATNIKKVLSKKNLTQLDLCNGTGINTSTMSRILSGKQNISTKQLVIISHFLDVEISKFMKDEEILCVRKTRV